MGLSYVSWGRFTFVTHLSKFELLEGISEVQKRGRFTALTYKFSAPPVVFDIGYQTARISSGLLDQRQSEQ